MKNWVLGQDNNFYLISLSILSSYLLDDVLILGGEVTCQLLLGAERDKNWNLNVIKKYRQLSLYGNLCREVKPPFMVIRNQP